MNQSQFLIYISESGLTKIDVRLEDDTAWLSQKMMADSYQTTKQNINLHIQNIYEEGELAQEPTVKENLTVENQSKSNRTVRNFRIVQQEGKREVERDVGIAKNYLNENELLALNNLVEQYLVFAEGQAMRRIPMYMQDWITKLNGFLSLNDREILDHAGKISHELAVEHSEKEYNLFHQKRMQESNKKESDFDKAIQNIPPKKKGK